MKDALERRSRFAKPQPTDEKIVLTERDYRLFEAIDRHGKLPTNYLYEFSKDVCRDYSFLQRRLTQLYNGFKDKRGNVGSYVTRDWQQWNNFKARYQPAIYGITPLAKKVLYSLGRAVHYSPERNDPFVHQFFGACFSASVELQAHRFISREDILLHEKCPENTKELKNPFGIPVAIEDMHSIVPDNLFGIEYPQGGFRFFAVEIDRNTESIYPKKPVKNSIAKKIAGYVDVYRTKAFETHFGIPNLTVLLATTNSVHADNILKHIDEHVPDHWKHKFLVKAFTEFGENWNVPRELLPVFEWKSVKGEVNINKKPPA